MTKLTRYEMETTINFNADETMAILYTRDKSVMRRLDKLVAEFPDVYKCTRKTDIDKTYTFPKKYAIPRKPRILSAKQREEMRERLAKAREGQRQNNELDEELYNDLDENLDEDLDDDLDEVEEDELEEDQNLDEEE